MCAGETIRSSQEDGDLILDVMCDIDAQESIPEMVKRHVQEAYDETKVAMAKKYQSTFTPEQIVAGLQPQLDAVNVQMKQRMLQREAEAFTKGVLVGCAIGAIGMLFTAVMLTT